MIAPLEYLYRISNNQAVCLRTGIVVLSFLLINCVCTAQNISNSQHLDQAFSAARQGDLTQVNHLLTNAADYLLEAERYLEDPDERVRVLIIDFAMQVKSPKSMELLTQLIADNVPSISAKAAKVIFEKYSCDEIVNLGGESLKENLLRSVNSSGRDIRTILLLSCYKGDQAVITTLTNLRVKYVDRRIVFHSYEPSVPYSMGIDIALTILNHNEATERIRNIISNGEVNELLFISNVVKLIDNRGVLLQLTELLKDRRNAKRSGPSGTNSYVRICDVILESLIKQANIDFGLDTASFRGRVRYSDDIIAEAYTKLKAHFQNSPT